MKLRLGKITLDVPFFQAPLSGYSDYAMRRLALDFGSPLVFAGMMLDKSAANPKVLRKSIFKPRDDEHPIGAQIVGNDLEVMVKAAKGLASVGYDLIDLNFACPAPKVLRRRRGGALLKEPNKVIEILKAVRSAVDCPVTMKLRTGFDSSTESKEKFWEIVEKANTEGVDALVIHGRTVKGYYRGLADWEVLSQVKQKFADKVIIGSGDLFEPIAIAEILRETGLDGVSIARGAIGNPWIFSRLKAIYEDKTGPIAPTIQQQGETILKHFELVSQLYANKKAVRYFRKFMAGYCKLHPNRKKTLKIFMAAKNRDQFFSAVNQCYFSVV